jgi:membrane fusion protein, multidrug efflux system
MEETTQARQVDTAPPPLDARPATTKPDAPPAPKRSGFRSFVTLLIIVAALGAGAFYGYPVVVTALTTVSTDDAYVNAHSTSVAPRIQETVLDVKFDNNDHVKKGDLLITLDDRMSKIKVAQADAAVQFAISELNAEDASARSTVASAKANRYKLASAIADIGNQIGSLRAAIADLTQRQAAEQLAKLEADRYAKLAKANSVTQEQADVRITDLAQSHAGTEAALQKVRQIRASLEVELIPKDGKKLDDVPPDLDQIHSSVRSALGALSLDLAKLGLPQPHFQEKPDSYVKRILDMAPGGDFDRLINDTVAKAPGVQTARARVEQANQDKSLAELNLSYCNISADISGFISNRNVNPGDRVAQGQRLMVIHSDEEVWIDCNLKETQLDPVRIGQPVDLYVDTYPDKLFHARVTGINPGTGAALALLPAQNATGNFVKIVQRIPVRIELIGDKSPKDTPFFVGLSCTPYIRIFDQPEGPNAGQRLRGNFPKVELESKPPLGIRPTSAPPADQPKN